MTKLQILIQQKEVTPEMIEHEIKIKKSSFSKQNGVLNTKMMKSYQTRNKIGWEFKYQNWSDYLNYEDNLGNSALIYAIRRKEVTITDSILNQDKLNILIEPLFKKIKNFYKFDESIHLKVINKIKENYYNFEMLIKENSRKTSLLVEIIQKSSPEVSLLYIKKFKEIIIKLRAEMKINEFNLISNFDKLIKKSMNRRNSNGLTLLGTIIKLNLGIEHLKPLIELGLDVNKKYTTRLSVGKKISYEMPNKVSFRMKHYNGTKKDDLIFSTIPGIKTIQNIDDENNETINPKLVKRKKNIYYFDEFPIHQALKFKSFNTLSALLQVPNIKENIKDKLGKTIENKINKNSEEELKILTIDKKSMEIVKIVDVIEKEKTNTSPIPSIESEILF